MDLMCHVTDINKVTGSLCEAPGFPRRKLLMREGVDWGQMENAGNSLLGCGGLAEPGGMALCGEGNAICIRSVLRGVGPGELSCMLGLGLWT